MSFDLTSLLGAIGKLAPLSVVIAALALLNSFRQARIKRLDEKALNLREVLNQLGTKSYLLNWSLVGNSVITAGVLQVREMIESRIGQSPSNESLVAVLNDKLLVEALVEKGFRDSGVVEKFQREALEFGRLRADLGNRVPLAQAALEVIDTRLRSLFLVNVILVYSIRNDVLYQEICRSADPIVALHKHLLRAAQIPDKKAFPEACKFLEEFSDVMAAAGDKIILGLVRPRQFGKQRIKEWFSERRAARAEHQTRENIILSLKEKFPGQSSLLCAAAEEIMAKSRSGRVIARQLEHSSERILHALKGNPGWDDLNDASAKFLRAYSAEAAAELESENSLLRLKCLGVDDPDVDVFLATCSGVTELLKSAIDRGGRTNITLADLFAKHAKLLSGEGLSTTS